MPEPTRVDWRYRAEPATRHPEPHTDPATGVRLRATGEDMAGPVEPDVVAIVDSIRRAP